VESDSTRSENTYRHNLWKESEEEWDDGSDRN
jgi:hypothetical protein